jgi:hypothetical protein
MEERQCALAVEGANEAAAAARRVQVGGGGPQAAVQQLVQDPTTWAYLALAALAVLRRPLTPTVRAGGRRPAGRPYVLLCCAAGWVACGADGAPRVSRIWGSTASCSTAWLAGELDWRTARGLCVQGGRADGCWMQLVLLQHAPFLTFHGCM